MFRPEKIWFAKCTNAINMLKLLNWGVQRYVSPSNWCLHPYPGKTSIEITICRDHREWKYMGFVLLKLVSSYITRGKIEQLNKVKNTGWNLSFRSTEWWLHSGWMATHVVFSRIQSPFSRLNGKHISITFQSIHFSEN